MIELFPWILLAIVAYFALRKSVAAARVPPSLPSLSTGPALPSLGPVAAPPAGGPHPLTLLSILAAGAMVSLAIAAKPAPPSKPDPPPAPAPAGWPTIDLRGAFVGEHAAEDALTTHYLTKWLANDIAYDGTLPEPRLKTAAAFDDLRVVARDNRMEGGTLGQRQPLVRERIKAFLDAAVGDSGGPVDPPGRAKFVRALGDVSKAAALAVGRKSE